jgi:methyltransferase (TIGR00027 family)
MRPCRIEGLKSGVRVFEVDHPATQDVKKAKLKNIFGSLPGHVTFVPVRFNSQDLGERLLRQGFDPALRTLFVWEGVTMYLKRPAVDRTLGFLRTHSAPGSSVIFDVIPASAVNGPDAPREGRALKKNVTRLGEELRFGIESYEIETFLTARGFVDVKSINSRDCREIYFTGVNAHRKVSGVFYFVNATVTG